MRIIHKDALEIIKYAEAGRGINARSKDGRYLYRTCYLCPANVPTIGYGNISTVTRADVGRKTITEREADAIFDADLFVKTAALDRVLQGITLNDEQYGAILSLVFNIGIGNFAKSTVFKKLKAGKFKDVPAAMRMWNKGKVNGKLTVLPGLVSRRTREAELFAFGTYGTDDRMVTGSTPVHEAVSVVARVSLATGAIVDKIKAALPKKP
jgi:lysozyme